ncbi:hypothetical protein B566_EDAN016037, partial [Ephemera danica]
MLPSLFFFDLLETSVLLFSSVLAGCRSQLLGIEKISNSLKQNVISSHNERDTYSLLFVPYLAGAGGARRSVIKEIGHIGIGAWFSDRVPRLLAGHCETYCSWTHCRGAWCCPGSSCAERLPATLSNTKQPVSGKAENGDALLEALDALGPDEDDDEEGDSRQWFDDRSFLVKRHQLGVQAGTAAGCSRRRLSECREVEEEEEDQEQEQHPPPPRRHHSAEDGACTSSESLSETKPRRHHSGGACTSSGDSINEMRGLVQSAGPSGSTRRHHSSGGATESSAESLSACCSGGAPFSPHLDKRFVDHSLVELRSLASSCSTLDYDSTDDIWVMRGDDVIRARR